MDDASRRAVEGVIRYMYEKLEEEVTINDMAQAAMFSKFHFSRMFREMTGISPGRFLSAIRLQTAKRLLISTSLTVTDICYRVGYNSIGTFSSRFTTLVGVSPTLYRECHGFLRCIPVNERRNQWGTVSGLIQGRVLAPRTGEPSWVFVGVFPDPIIQGQPIRYAVLSRAGRYVVEDVPQGTWHILAHSPAVGDEGAIRDPVHDDKLPFVGGCGPIVIGSGGLAVAADVQLRPMRVIDPPVLLATVNTRPAAVAVPYRMRPRAGVTAG
jgi:AraC family transcriptional regulator